MHNWVLKLVIASLLFVSMEGLADSVDEISFHQTHHAHADDADAEWFPDTDGSDHDGDACEHFCHAHGVALVGQITLPNVSMSQTLAPSLPEHAVNRSYAPPTPPPNL